MVVQTTDIKPISTTDITPSTSPLKEITEKTEATNPVVGPDAGGTRTVTGDAPSTEGSGQVDPTAPPSGTDVVRAAEASTLSTTATGESIAADIERKDVLVGQTTERITEDVAAAQEDIQRGEEFRASQEGIITEADRRTQEIEQAKLDLVETTTRQEDERIRTEADLAFIRQEKEVEVAEAALQLQKVKDDNAIKQAETDIDVAHQQANWAFNKLGLTFSSGALLQTQQIATNGANKLAEIKVQSSYNQALMSVEVAKLNEAINKTQAEYSSQINGNINNYQDKQITIQDDATQRIRDTSNSLLLNDKQQADNINGIKDQLRDDIRTNEDEFQKEQERLTDRILDQAKDLEKQIQNNQNLAKTKINDALTNGSLFTKTAVEKEQMAAAAGITINELTAIENTQLSSTISSDAAKIMGDSAFVFSKAEKEQTSSLAKQYMESGMSFQSATETATLETLSANPDYQNVKAVKDLTVKKELSSLQAGGGTAIKTSDLKTIDVGGVEHWAYWDGTQLVDTGTPSYNTPDVYKQELSDGTVGIIDQGTGKTTIATKALPEGVEGPLEQIQVPERTEGTSPLMEAFIAKNLAE